MRRRKISTTVYLTEEQAERLRGLSERSGTPAAVLVRRGVEHVIATAERYERALAADPKFREGLGPVESVVLSALLGGPATPELERMLAERGAR